MYHLHKLWSWLPMAGITFGSHIFVKSQHMGNDVLLAHELVHVRQQKEHFWKFWFTYLLFPLPIFYSWRYRWEAEAYAVDVRAGCPLDEIAKMMCGSGYLWPCRFNTAKAEIQKHL